MGTRTAKDAGEGRRIKIINQREHDPDALFSRRAEEVEQLVQRHDRSRPGHHLVQHGEERLPLRRVSLVRPRRERNIADHEVVAAAQ